MVWRHPPPPPIDDFFMRRTWNYLSKVYRTKQEMLPKKMFGVWIPAASETGKL